MKNVGVDGNESVGIDEKLGFVIREIFGDLWRERKTKRFVGVELWIFVVQRGTEK